VYWLLVALLVCCGTSASAADGSSLTAYATGAYAVYEYFLCDGDHTTTDCNEIDLHREIAGGLPEYVVADLNSTTGCAGAVTVDVRGLADAVGFPSIIQQLTLAGVSSVVLDPTTHRFVDGVVGVGAGCTDLEVILRFFYPRL